VRERDGGIAGSKRFQDRNAYRKGLESVEKGLVDSKIVGMLKRLVVTREELEHSWLLA
jgi:hypothetical protein